VYDTTDLTELTLPSNIKITFPEGKDKPMHFEIAIRADEGMYRCVGGWGCSRGWWGSGGFGAQQ
jgi:hypothetical protein